MTTSSMKVSEWLKLMTNVTEYNTDGSRMGILTNCTECGRTLRGETVRKLCITGISLKHNEEERVFRNICNECYSRLKSRIYDKMK